MTAGTTVEAGTGGDAGDDDGRTVLLPVASAAATRRRVAALLRPRLPLAVLAGLAMIASTVAGIAVPVVVGAAVDVVVNGDAASELTRWGLVLAALAVAGASCTVVAELLVAHLGEPAVAQLREEVMDRALDLESGAVESAGSGDLLARLSSDVRALSDVVRVVLVDFTGAGLTVVLSVGGMAVIDYRLGIAAACAVPIQAWATWRYARRAPAQYAELARARGEESRQLLDSIGGATTVRSLGLGPAHREAIGVRAHRARDITLATVRLQTTFGRRLNLAELVGVSAILVVGFVLVRDGAVTEGGAAAAALMFLRLFNPINIVLGLVDEVLSAFAGLARLAGVLEAPAEPRPPDGPAPADGGVRLEDVAFAYRAGHNVVRGVDLAIAPGERLAVVGTSGAGKSTLGALVAGLRRPRAGRVLVGGVPLAELSPRQRRATVAMVTQDVHVFRGPLRDDLTLAAPGAGDDRLRAALAAVGAGDWAEALPDGLGTVIGAGGHGLTPVQEQQLALARLILADPAVAVLDEATAEADSSGARLLEDGVDAATAGRTAIVVAHRLSQAARCDRVAVMEAGRIVELGRHDELLAAGGVYARLWAAWDGRGPGRSADGDQPG